MDVFLWRTTWFTKEEKEKIAFTGIPIVSKKGKKNMCLAVVCVWGEVCHMVKWN